MRNAFSGAGPWPAYPEMKVGLIAIALAAGCPAMLSGQGFSGKLGNKTTIVLERKLPAAVTLRGNSFSVKAVAVRPLDPCQKMAADKLQSTVETALIRYNSQLQLDPDKPDTVISVRVINCNAIATAEYSTSFTGKNKGQQQQTGVKVNGDLTVAYQAKTRAGASVDAEPIDVKYQHEFNNVAAAVSETKKIIGKLPLVGKKHQDDDDSDDPAYQRRRSPDHGEPSDAESGGAVGKYQRARGSLPRPRIYVRRGQSVCRGGTVVAICGGDGNHVPASEQWKTIPIACITSA